MKYILNIGHNTVSGSAMSREYVAAKVAECFAIQSHSVVTGEYQGNPEETSVIRFESNDEPANVFKQCAALSDVLDQECIALAHYVKGIAFGVIVGANPAKIEFDFDYFRI